MARPTKLTKELHEKLLSAIRAGNYMETAAAYAGISKDTLYNWMRRGARESERLAQNPRAKPKKSEQEFLEFSDAVEKALAQAEVRDIANIAKASDAGDWRASAWRLERKYPEKWGRKDRLDAELKHTGKDGGPIQTETMINLTTLSDEELTSLEHLIEKTSDTSTG
jgi:transposase